MSVIGNVTEFSTASRGKIGELAERYGEAWNAHDVDAILAMHAEDMVFQLHLPGYGEVTGDDNLRAHFRMFFEAWPDLEFRTMRLSVGETLFTNEMEMVGTLSAPLPIGAVVLEPNGERIGFDAVDVIPVENGRVKRKDTYVDAASLFQKLSIVNLAHRLP